MNTRTKRLTIALTVTTALLALLVLSTSAAPLHQAAAPPERITYQGHLLDSANDPVPDDGYSMVFRLYDAASGGSLLWGPETHPVTTTAGYFSVLLGETTPITAGTFAASTYLEVAVDGETLIPRHQFASVPFALIASDVSEATLGDLDCTTDQVAAWNGTAWACTTAASGDITSVTAGDGLSGGGTSGAVTLNVSTATLGDLSCTTDQIAQWNGSAWECATAGGGGVSMPVGSIIPWHKNISGTLTLPDGWLECDGQTVSDPASPINGVTLPNLNSDTQDGSTNSGMFLRGASASGDIQSDATVRNGLNVSTNALKYYASSEWNAITTGTASYKAIHRYKIEPATASLSSTDSETRPANMTVVWIIRIK